MTKLQTKSIRHTFRRSGRFYYSRRVPSDLMDHYKVPRIVRALGTSDSAEARRLATAATAKLERFWAALRLQRRDVIGADLLLNDVSAIAIIATSVQPDHDPQMPTFAEAKEVYLKHKAAGRPKTFTAAADRTTAYLTGVCGNKPLDRYTRQDALDFRDWLVERGLSGSSVTRNFSYVKAIFNFATSEYALDLKTPFTGVYYDKLSGVAVRQPIPLSSIRIIQQECRRMDDEIRWLVALISDTGLRLAEAAGLLREDIFDVVGEPPHISVRSHPWRSLKTNSSERLVPLVGSALWAARRTCGTQKDSPFAFPRYNRHNQTAANAASAALNKWMKTLLPENHTLHGFRHSFRDRLRSVECPAEIVDQLGGWSSGDVGKSYGEGYPLRVLHGWMVKAIEGQSATGASPRRRSRGDRVSGPAMPRSS